MNYQIYTMYVNGLDLLKGAIAALEGLQAKVVVLDNSPRQNLVLHEFSGEILRPSAPLSCAQSYNLISSLARERGQDFFFIMHSDAEASPEVVIEMLRRAADLEAANRKWGVMFSHYDVLCLHPTARLHPFRWDQNLPVSFTDVDFYRRLVLSGLEIIETGLEVRHMNEGSSTRKNDPILQAYIQINFEAWHEYYRVKWGGSRDEETYDTPFGLGIHSMLWG